MSTLLILLVIVGVGYAMIYNGLVQARQKAKEAWSAIDVQLKRRYDLVPNLINTVKGYATHESGTLEKVIQARTSAMDVSQGGKVGEIAQAENMLSGALKSIFALSESYPDLKANQNFLELQNELTDTEDQISAARRIYNGNVTVMNTKVQSFPSNVIANLHHFGEEQFFELEESEKNVVKNVPKVEF